MSTLTNYSKAVWLPLVFIVAVMNFNVSVGSAQDIQWHEDLQAAKVVARDTNRLVWLHFTADWCVPCKRLESFVFRHTGVVRAADRNAVAVKIDADTHESLIKQLDVPRLPYDVMMTPSGRVILSRRSPKDSAGFLKMFDSLDRPLQELNDGDREVINARIDKLHGLIKRSTGLTQNKSDLDLAKPSHQMASTTVEGQRLERGFESSQRASKFRTAEAQVLKQNAEKFIAQQQKNNPPKFAENPFYKPASSATASTVPSSNQFQGVSRSTPKTMSNSFVKPADTAQSQSSKVDSAFVLPPPPTFGQKPAKERAIESVEDLKLFEDREEFSFAPTEPQKSSVASQRMAAKQVANFAAPKFSTPKFSPQKSSSLALPQFKGQTGNKADSNKFAYAPIDELRKSLRNESRPNEPNKTPAFRQQTQVQSRPTFKSQGEAFAKFEQPRMKTEVSVPQPPVMLEGVVKISETTVPAIEGRLVAAEQSFDEGSLVRMAQAQDSIEKQISRTDRLLESMEFFAEKSKTTPPAPQRVAAPTQSSQPQIVINVNSGEAAKPQPVPAAKQGVTIQPNFAAGSNSPSTKKPANMVAQASSTAAANRASISRADATPAVRSKYALKGKCPVTLLTEGRWVDGNKEIGCVHRNRVYLFANAAHRESFLADPDRLSPLLAGFDPVIFEETGKLIEGEEKYGTFMGKKPNQRIVLFRTADTRDRFQKEPSKYLNVVRRVMTEKDPKNVQLR